MSLALDLIGLGMPAALANVLGNAIEGTDGGLSVAELDVLDGAIAGTVVASKAVVVDSNKDVSSFRDVIVRNLDAGASGVAGTVDVFPTTAAHGKFQIAVADQTGDTAVTHQVAAMGQATVVTLPDPGATTASYVLSKGANTLEGAFAQGSNATDRVSIKGFYKNPAVIAVAVPTIANDAAENVDSVDVSVAAAFAIQPAIGDAVIAIPLEALPTDCVLLGAWVSGTDQITVSFGSKEGGGGVTGANKNFDFLVLDLT